MFADLAAAFAGRLDRIRPTLGDVGAPLRRHAELLVEFFEDEGRALRDLRKHVAWYFKGYPVGGQMRHRLATMERSEEHTSELQSRGHLVCRLLLEKQKPDQLLADKPHNK